ncbi:MAG: ATP-grasp domain-containing protein [Clostridiales bacterium]|nr:ATP-grasp domain-containing protein [Clostridiales bacterium]
MVNLMVVFGGESCEHDISVITGVQLIANCNEYLYNVIPVYIDKCGVWYTGDSLKDLDNYPNKLSKLKKCSIHPNDDYLYIEKGGKFKKYIKVDCCIPCLHGLRGEDGTLFAILNMSKIPCSSSGLVASSVCIDKDIFKCVCSSLNINVANGLSINHYDYLLDCEVVFEKVEKLGYPIIIKPCRQGSSIGIYVCHNRNELQKNIEISFKYDSKVVIEKFIDIKKEVNIALFEYLGDLIFSNTEEPKGKDEILSFDDKYKRSGGNFENIKRIIPAEIDTFTLDKIKEISRIVYCKLGMIGVVRFDFIIDKDDNVYLNEVNSIPGSMANYLFDKKMYPYSKLIDMLVRNGIKLSVDSCVKVIDSGVLGSGLIGIKK